jgi:hypothetical protein
MRINFYVLFGGHAGRSGDCVLQERHISFAQKPVEKHLPIPVAPYQNLFGTGGSSVSRTDLRNL